MNLIAIEDLLLRDLVELFMKQVNPNGVAKLAPLFGDGEDPSNGPDIDTSENDDFSADVGIDYLSVIVLYTHTLYNHPTR